MSPPPPTSKTRVTAAAISLAQQAYLAGAAAHQGGQHDVALAAYHQAIAHNPNHAEALNNIGGILIEKTAYQQAAAYLERAVQIRPRYGDALFNLGNALSSSGRRDDALVAFRKASSIDPKNAKVANATAVLLREARRLEDATKMAQRVVRSNPSYVRGWYELGVTLSEFGRPEESVEAFSSAVRLAPEFAEAHFARSMSRLQLGDYAGGFSEYEWRKRLDKPHGARPVDAPLWLGDGEIEGKSIYVHREQGLGDALQFCRYALLLRELGARVTVGVPDVMIDLAASLHQDIVVVDEARTPTGFDYHAPMMSLPLACGTRLDTVPSWATYLKAAPSHVARWRARLGEGIRPRLGICWSSNPANKALTKRSCDLSAFLTIFDNLDVDLTALQQHISPGDLSLIQDHGIRDVSALLHDFSETAALVDQLDAVITVDTSIAHLAGALGKPVLILLAVGADWRWGLTGAACSWYPSATLFRQEQPDDWSHPVGAVRRRLQTMF